MSKVGCAIGLLIKTVRGSAAPGAQVHWPITLYPEVYNAEGMVIMATWEQYLALFVSCIYIYTTVWN